MKKIIIAILAAGLSVAPSYANAQTGINISGQISTAESKPAGEATVLLIKAGSGDIVKTALADSAGRFLFERIIPGEYRITITLEGYKKYTGETFSVTQQPVTLPSIYLEQETKTLESISVTALKPIIVHKQDRIVVNADAFISAAGSTVMELLEKSPGVQVDQNGIISLKGRQGVTVYIDDKPSYLSGADLDNYLKSLPASSIDQIELMSNPPSRYDAAGNGGIINIKTKKNTRGFNSALTLALTQGKMTRSNNSFNFNYRNNKISLFTLLSHNLNNSFSDLDLTRTYMNADHTPRLFFAQNSYFKRHGNTFTLKSGADYYASDKTTWGIVLSGMTRSSTELNDNTSNLSDVARKPDSIIIANNREDIHFKNAGINLNYRRSFGKKDHELTADADYLAYRDVTQQVNQNSGYLLDMTLKSKDLLTGYLPANIDIYSLKTDYSQPLNSQWKMDAGVKFSFTKTNNTADYTTTTDSGTRPDYDKSNHFIYKENINALYMNLSGKIRALSVQGGLRVENTVSDGHQLGNIQKSDSTFKKDYTNLFPVLYLTYQFDSLANHQIGLNYGRRIDRPYYQDLNPFLSPLDKFTYYTGNPFLKPAFTHALELSYTYKNKITTTLSYSRTKDQVNETIEIRDGIYYSKPANIGLNILGSISVDGNIAVTRWLNLQIYAAYMINSAESEFYTGRLKTSGAYVYVNPAARIAFGKGWDGELSGNYTSKSTDAQFIVQGYGQANAAIKKTISPALTLKAVVNDIFYSRVVNGIINNLALAQAGWKNRSDSRSVALSISYRFGKLSPEQKRTVTARKPSKTG